MIDWGNHPGRRFEGSDINPSVDEQSFDQIPEHSRTQGYAQPFDQLANPLLLARSMFLCHHLPTSPHLDLGRAAAGCGAPIETVTVGRLRRVPEECLAEYVTRLRQDARSMAPAA
jgi:hypothetical protein